MRSATDHKFLMLPDSKNIVGPDSRGRDSIRISSKWAFDESVVIIDLEHMPYGCATWPAFWTLSQEGPWPTGGEVDIIEVIYPSRISIHCAETCMRQGVNEADQNLISLHTLPGCTMPEERWQLGRVPPSSPLLLRWWLIGVLAERPHRRTVTPTSTSTRVVELGFAPRILTAKISTQSEADSTPSPVAKSMVSRFGSGPEKRLSHSTSDTIVRPSTRTLGVPPQPTSRLEITVNTRNISTPTCSSLI